MSMQFDILEAEALKLGAGERARLAEHLIASLDEDPELDAAWEAEIQKRIHEIDSGQVQMLSASEVLAQARSMLK
jgi:putative addiction module component (TIGR02574 family)